MLHGDLFLVKRLIDLRVEEAQRQAGDRKLQHLARRARQSGGAPLMVRLSRYFVSLGAWLVRYSLPQLQPAERPMGGG